jgi:hypothetical protein
MVYFQTKKTNLGKFWRALDLEILIYFIVIWNILPTFGIFYDHLVHFVFIWYIIPGFGIMHQEKSGIPATLSSTSVRFFSRTSDPENVAEKIIFTMNPKQLVGQFFAIYF